MEPRSRKKEEILERRKQEREGAEPGAKRRRKRRWSHKRGSAWGANTGAGDRD